MGRYRALARIEAARVLVYRTDYLLGLAGLLLQIYLLRVLWTAIYAERPTDNAELAALVVYSTLASIQGWLLNPWEFSLIPQRVRNGRVTAELSRPVGFIAQVIAGHIGRTLVMFPFALLMLPIAVVVGGVQGPAGPAAAAGYLLASLLGYLVSMPLSIVVGMSAFWTLETSGMFMMFRVVSMFLSGALVPLWVMPDWLRGITTVLPFQSITYTPVAIYVGHLSGPAAVRALALSAAWVLVMIGLARLVWARGLHRVVVQGG